MSNILGVFYYILNPIEYNRDKNRQAAKIMAQGMTIQELVEQSDSPYELQDGVAEVFLDQIIQRLQSKKSNLKRFLYEKNEDLY